jgi:hypothetical protein
MQSWPHHFAVVTASLNELSVSSTQRILDAVSSLGLVESVFIGSSGKALVCVNVPFVGSHYFRNTVNI